MNDAALSTTSAETGVDRPGDTIVLPGQAPDGTPILSVLIKRTYLIRSGARCVRAERDRKLVPGDRHFGDPMNTCVEFESDFVPYKLATDVVLNGAAIAPGGSPVYELTAALTIGDVVRTVQMIGDRNAQYRAGAAPVFTDPVPFAKMPVRYDLAFGGVDTQSNPKMACVYGQNHLGRGFAIRNVPEVVDGLALPNIEHPTDRLTPDRLCCGHFVHMDTQPEPLGFGWMMKGWRPRLLLAGIMPADVALAGELRQAYAWSCRRISVKCTTRPGCSDGFPFL